MVGQLNGYNLILIGGDQRESVASRRLAEAGAAVSHLCPGVPEQETADMQVRGVHAVVYPVRGMDRAGMIAGQDGYGPLKFDRRQLEGLLDSGVVIVGSARPELMGAAARRGVRVIELLTRDDFCIFNAIPTAEGAIAAAVMAMPATLHGSRVLVAGYGRCGRPLARRLLSLGAKTVVAARSSAALAEAMADGHQPLPIDDLNRIAPELEAVFNTVPAVVFTRAVVELLGPGVHVFELASDPGGFDREAIAGRGITYHDLPGLPGRSAPVTAGYYLAMAVADIVREHTPAPT